MSIPRRLGRLARGFVFNLKDDDRLRETIRVGRERGETLKETFGEAFEAAWRGAAEEWRTAEEERRTEERGAGEAQTSEEKTSEEKTDERRSSRSSSSGRGYAGRAYAPFIPRKFPPNVISAYHKLGLDTGENLEEVSRKRRDLVKRYHPDRFSDPDKRARAERLTAEINAAHDTIARHLLR